MGKKRMARAGKITTKSMAARQRSAYCAAWVLRSLEKDGAGTVSDLVERDGAVARYETEIALQRLISEKYVRRVKKDYGYLYVVERKREDKAAPRRGSETTRWITLTTIRDAGASGMFQTEIGAEVGRKAGAGLKAVSNALKALERAGLVRRTFYDQKRIVWTAADFTPERGESTREEARLVRGDAFSILDAFVKWTFYAKAASELGVSTHCLRCKMRGLLKAGLVESRSILCEDGRMRKQWRAIASAK